MDAADRVAVVESTIRQLEIFASAVDADKGAYQADWDRAIEYLEDSQPGRFAQALKRAKELAGL